MLALPERKTYPSLFTLTFSVSVDSLHVIFPTPTGSSLTLFNFYCSTEPLGYPAEVPAQNQREFAYTHAGETIQHMISSCRRIAKVLTIKDGQTCDARLLSEKMQLVPDIIEDWQKSSARGAARIALSMALAHYPEMDLNTVTTAILDEADAAKLLKACEGYDHRISKGMDHSAFFDLVVLPEDEDSGEGTGTSHGSGNDASFTFDEPEADDAKDTASTPANDP